jgi:hypothetical protein
LLGYSRASAPQNVGFVQMRFKVFDLDVRAGVVLLDGAADMLSLRIDQDCGGHHAADTYSSNLPGLGTGLLQALWYGHAYILPPFQRLLFGPIGVWGMQSDCSLSFGQDVTFGIDQDDLGRGGANINAQKEDSAHFTSSALAELQT